MNVEFDAHALEDWRRLELKDAAAVGRAVEAWARDGTGLVEATEGGGVFRLYVGAQHVVRFVVDDTTETMHVVQIRGPKA